MKKIISLFQRNYDGDRKVRDEIVPGAEWVVNGEGVATRKYDGTSCMVRDGKLYKRYDAKHGKKPPTNWEPAQDPDPVTGHWPGWLPVGEGNEDRWHREAFEVGLAFIAVDSGESLPLENGTYELCGPKLQGNPDGFERHVFMKHGADILDDAPRDFEGIKAYLEPLSIEGIVWHHPDGRMVKIKRRDFDYVKEVA